MKKAMVIALVALVLCGCSNGNGIVREEGSPETNVGERFITNDCQDEFETVVDSETGVTYLVWTRDGNLEHSKGGITPLLNRDGTPVISEEVGE